MIDYKAQIADLIGRHLPGVPAEELAAALEIPTDERMGDYALPCFRLARTLRKAPPAIAGELAANLAGEALFESVEAVNGYVGALLDGTEFNGEVFLLDGTIGGVGGDPGFDPTRTNTGFNSMSVVYELPPVQGIRGIVRPVYAERK